MINATIVGINQQKGRAVAITEYEEYVLLEIMGADEFQIYDEIRANFDLNPLGDEPATNISTGKKINLYIQNYCGKKLAQQYLNS